MQKLINKKFKKNLFRKKNIKKTICPNCMKFCVPKIITINESLNIRGEEISVTHNVEKCNLCSQTFNSLRCPENSIPQAFKIYRNKHNLFNPEDLINLASKMSISLIELKSRLNWDDQKFNLYLTGALPSVESDLEFKRIADSYDFKNFIDTGIIKS